jgi:hypothetical protein
VADPRTDPQLAQLELADHGERPADVVQVIVRHDHRGQPLGTPVDEERNDDPFPRVEAPSCAAPGIDQQVGSVGALERHCEPLPHVDNHRFHALDADSGRCSHVKPDQAQAE